jgi:hypothetical protein
LQLQLEMQSMETELKFYEEFTTKISVSSPEYINEDYTIVIKPVKLEETKLFLDLYTIAYDIIQQDKIAISIDSFPCKLFWNDELFLKKTTNVSSFDNDLLILNIDNALPCKLYLQKNTYIDFVPSDNNWFFINSRGYLKFIDILSEQNERYDEVFHFIDDFSKSTGKGVFTSAKDFGKLILKLNYGILKLNEEENYALKIERFEECFLPENKHLPKFLKNEFFNFLLKEKEQERIYTLFNKFDEIINSANLNFEVYLNDLSLEGLKKDYSDYKQKYFNQLSDFLNSFTNKIIALPLTVSAILFGITKATESNISLTILITALIITCFYLFGILRINIEDLDNIDETFKRDYSQFSKSSFFIKFPEEEQYFIEVKRRIESKIDKLKAFTKLFYWITAISHSALIIYCFSFIFKFTLPALALISIMCFFLTALIFIYYITPENNK